MKHVFFVKEIPDPFSVWNYIKSKTDIEQQVSKLVPKVDTTQLINLNHSFNIDELSKVTLGALDRFGFHGWRYTEGEGKDYGGLSLSYNPDYQENCDPNQQTLGTPSNHATEFFYGQTQNFKSIRNSYFDTYGFRKHAPCVAETGLKDFLDSFNLSCVRGRLAVINSQYVPASARERFGWHKDEPVWENLRINIPIKTDDTFMFQLVKKQPEHLAYGNLYTWDTNLPHRVFPTTEEVKDRVHLVLGFSPWFDYDEEKDAWVSNEFYGEVHPIDMLIDGHVHDKIKGVR